MATRLKTVEYWFPIMDTLPNASFTFFTPITVYIPESSPTFHSVVVDVILSNQATAASNTTGRIIEIGLGTFPAIPVAQASNAVTLTNSGENYTIVHSGDFTDYFNTWWSGTSMALNSEDLFTSSAAGFANLSQRIRITYEYDDTSTTQIKTVHIPLDSRTIAQLAAKGAAIDTIPALDTYLPEASKVYRQINICVQGNQESSGSVDMSISFEIDSLGANTSVVYEKGLASSSWYRYSNVVTFDTSTTHDFYLWASITDFDHAQVYMTVTYEFNASTTTRVMNSVLIPMEFPGSFGNTTSADAQTAYRDFWIQEPGTITTERIAYFMHYDANQPVSTGYAKIGSGSFINYSSVASQVCGGLGLMIRNDTAFTLAKGRNVLTASAYSTSSTGIGYNVSGFFIINYSSDKHTDGVGVHNHTIAVGLKTLVTTSSSVVTNIAAKAINLVSSDFFINSFGFHYTSLNNAGSSPAGTFMGVERLSSEGVNTYETIYEGIGGSDPEVGIRQVWGSARSVFKRFSGGGLLDHTDDRLDFQTARKYRIVSGNHSATYDMVDVVVTLHSITYDISGTISNSNGGTVSLSLHRESDGEKLLETSRVGNGAYSFTWFDDTELVYVEAYEDGTYKGRSANDYAT